MGDKSGRLIPLLLTNGTSLIKPHKFGSHRYVGDPANTVRIFSELEADELILIDMFATRTGRGPNWKLLEQVAREAFMPIVYGGGISCVDDASKVLEIGFEKIAVNSLLEENPLAVQKIAERVGSQAVIASIDYSFRVADIVRKRHRVWPNTLAKVELAASRASDLGCGEILLTSVEREGTWVGYDLETVAKISGLVELPVIAHGGAGSMSDVKQAMAVGASAAAAGSMLIFQAKNQGVLISYR